jgi:hypothetical protein
MILSPATVEPHEIKGDMKEKWSSQIPVPVNSSMLRIPYTTKVD